MMIAMKDLWRASEVLAVARLEEFVETTSNAHVAFGAARLVESRFFGGVIDALGLCSRQEV